jgi:hypothetical protein
MWKLGSQDLCHQVGVGGDPLVLQLMHEGAGRSRMLENSHDPHASLQDALRRRHEKASTLPTYRAVAPPVTGKTKHVVRDR